MPIPLRAGELDAALTQLVQEVYAHAGYWPHVLRFHPEDYAEWRAASARDLHFQLDTPIVVLAGQPFDIRLDPETPRGVVLAERE